MGSANLSREWTWVAAVVVGGVILFLQRGRPLRANDEMRETLTLITADRYDLSCASSATVDLLRCAYTEPGSPSLPPPEYPQQLVPYMTVQGHLFFIAGLFDQPALAQRLAAEPPTHRKRESLRRFDARCKLSLISQIDARLRFAPTGPHGDPQRGWVARVSDCSVSR